MARICASCRQPVGKDERDHDCLPDDEPGGGSSDEDEEAA